MKLLRKAFDPSPPFMARGWTLFFIGLGLTLATNIRLNVDASSHVVETSVYRTPEGLAHGRDVRRPEWAMVGHNRIVISYQHRIPFWVVQISSDRTAGPPHNTYFEDPTAYDDALADAISETEQLPPHIRATAARMIVKDIAYARYASFPGVIFLAAKGAGVGLMFLAPLLGAGRMIATAHHARIIRRLRNGICPWCAYELNPGDVPCPECGRDYREARRAALEALDRSRRRSS